MRDFWWCRSITYVACAACFLSVPNSASPQGRLDSVETARQILLAAYPELTHGSHTLQLVTNDDAPLNSQWTVPSRFSLRVQRPIDKDRIPSTASPEPILNADFTFAPESGRLIEVSIKGELAHSSEHEKICQLVDDHPEWTDRRIYAALVAAGSRMLPDQSQSLDFPTATAKALEPFLGLIAVKSVQFVSRAKMLNGDPALLEWGLIVETTPEDIHPSTYGLVFEPLEGKLLWVHAIELKLPPD